MLNRDLVQETTPNSYANWPGFLLRFGGIALSLFLIGSGYILNMQVITALGFVILAAALFLFWAARWATSRLYDTDLIRIIEDLFIMSQAQPEDKLAIIDLGLRRPAITLSHHLTTGQLVVVDVFNPQLNGGSELAKARGKAPHFQADPRLTRFDGNIELLPLPDSSVSAVFMPLVLSEFTQHGDRQKLLREVFRVTRPNGRLLCAEKNSNWLNWLSAGPNSSRFQPWSYWQNLLSKAGFEIIKTDELQGLTFCIRADKPSPFAGKQLSLGLQFNESRK